MLVKLFKYCEISGDTQEAVYSRKRKHVWSEGAQLVKAPDGTLWVDLEEVEKWVRQQPQESRRAA